MNVTILRIDYKTIAGKEADEKDKEKPPIFWLPYHLFYWLLTRKLVAYAKAVTSSQKIRVENMDMERNTLEGRVGLFGPSRLTLCGTKSFFICLSILPGEVEASSRGSRAALISSI